MIWSVIEMSFHHFSVREALMRFRSAGLLMRFSLAEQSLGQVYRIIVRLIVKMSFSVYFEC